MVTLEVGPHHLGRRDQFFLLFGGKRAGGQLADPEVDQLPGIVTEQRGELGVAVIGEVAAGLVHLDAADVRRIDRLIPAGQQLLLDELLQQCTDGGPFGHPEDEPLPHVVVDREESQLLAQHAVVAAFGLFDLREISLEFVLLEECGAVEALKLTIRRVSFPIGAGDCQQLERLDSPGVGNVRAAAQIDELALAVKADGRMLGQASVDVLDLQFLLEPFAEFAGLFAVENESLERLGVLDDLPHLLFDPRKILLADLLRTIEIVIEAVGESRPEREVDVRKEPHHGPRHHVSTRVPQHAERFGVAIGEQPQIDGLRDVCDFLEGPRAVDDSPIRLGSQHGLSEPRTDARGHVEAGAVVRILP